MKTTLKTDITVKDICDGFVYNELEGKAYSVCPGKLTIQPEYQRNYIYASDGGKKKWPLLNQYSRLPLGLIYFNRFLKTIWKFWTGTAHHQCWAFWTDKFAIKTETDEQYYGGMAKDKKAKILETKLLIYECEVRKAK